MKRALTIGGMMALAACASTPKDTLTISTMAYLQSPVEPSCALAALVAAEGFSVQDGIARAHGAAGLLAYFNEDLPVYGIVRAREDGSGELSFFVRLDEPASPLDEREAQFAVRAADEAVTAACTDTSGMETDAGRLILVPEETQEDQPLTP